MIDIPQVRSLVALALAEDLPSGDITAELTIPANAQGAAKIIAREELVLCGVDISKIVSDVSGWELKINRLKNDGDLVKPETEVVELSGSVRHLLSLERTILNFMQRMSGVATQARRIVESADGLTILDTRKTIPGFRALDKYAVKTGGAKNHRFSLSDMILVKNNHVDGHPKGLVGVLEEIFAKKPLYMPVEVEVRNQKELSEALNFPISIVMLDNFTPDQIKKAVMDVKAKSAPPLIEVSGGMTPEKLKAIKAHGVDSVSLGMLTTKAHNCDLSMRILPR